MTTQLSQREMALKCQRYTFAISIAQGDASVHVCCLVADIRRTCSDPDSSCRRSFSGAIQLVVVEYTAGFRGAYSFTVPARI